MHADPTLGRKHQGVAHRTKALTSVVVLAGAIVLGTVAPAEAHFNGDHKGFSLGDVKRWDGTHAFRLRVGNTSRFGSAVDHAINTWNNVRGAPVLIVRVAPAVADVVFKSPDNCQEHIGAWRPAQNDILLDVCRLEGREQRQKAVAAHELGHALGLPHLGPVDAGNRMLMAKDQLGPIATPQGVDVNHYRRWYRSIA